jgi:hypothetical protein
MWLAFYGLLTNIIHAIYIISIPKYLRELDALFATKRGSDVDEQFRRWYFNADGGL